jgi:hypothetical protein
MNDLATDPLPTDLSEHGQMIVFLRRFASLMSNGENSENLLRTSFLIEDFTAQIIHMKMLVETAQANAMESIAQRDAAEALLPTIKEELLQANAAREATASENAALLRRAEQAEAALAKSESEVARLRASLAAIGKSKVVMPVPTLESIRKQFEALAADFRKKGDIASEVMCEIGRTTIAQAIAETSRPNLAA